MAGASTVAAGIMTPGAIVASEDVAGTMRVFEAAVLTMKALGAASMVVNFTVAADSREMVEAFMAAEATEVAMADIAKGESLSNLRCLERLGRPANKIASRFPFWRHTFRNK